MRKIIAVIGDADITGDEKKRQICLDMGKALVDAGYRVSSGGGGGVMEAIFEGAKMSEKYVDGDTIAILISNRKSTANKYSDIIIPTGIGVLRNGITTLGDAVITIGGGAGTLSEAAFAWAYRKLLIAFNNVSGCSSQIAGTRLDHRIRYPEMPDDQVWSVSTAEEEIKILEEKLYSYNLDPRQPKHPGLRRPERAFPKIRRRRKASSRRSLRQKGAVKE